MTCNNATMNNAIIENGKIRITNIPANSNQYFSIESENGDKFSASGSRMWLSGSRSNIYFQGGYLNQAAISLTDSDGSNTSIYGSSILTPQLVQTSLERQKKNFEKLQDNALETLKRIDIYKYNLKNEKDTDKKHIGFVIGDNYNYSKEVTSIDNKGVDTYSFTSLCCKAIQELSQKVEELENRLNEKEKNNG